jgi:hypothetical protein
MKLLTTSLVTFLFTISVSAHAVSMRYTFSGNVAEIGDSGGLVAAANAVDPSTTDDIIAGTGTTGTEVTYVFDVDFGADGTITRYDGSTFTYTDDATDYFYSDFVSGGLIDGVYDTSGSTIEERNYGFQYPYRSGLLGRSYSEYTNIAGFGLVSSWPVGKSVTGYERAFNISGGYSYLRSGLTLTSISAVPRPAAALLIGLALIGVFGLSRRKQA